MSSPACWQPPVAAATPSAPAPAGRPGRGPGGPAGSGPGGRAGHGPTSSPTRPGAAATASAAEAELRRLVGAFAALFLEVEAGRRPRRHLEPLLTPLLWARLAPVWVRRDDPGCVVAVQGMLGAGGTFDAVAVVRRGVRFGALGLRLVHTRRGWRVDEVARPEDGPLPPPEHVPPPDEPDSFDVVLTADLG